MIKKTFFESPTIAESALRTRETWPGAPRAQFPTRRTYQQVAPVTRTVTYWPYAYRSVLALPLPYPVP